jgi:enamine deaminase RidA (YjgF/YER057c/UK114 family)
MRREHRTGGFEDVAGYARAVRIDNWIAVSATAPTDDSGRVVHEGDLYSQTKLAFERALGAVQALGGNQTSILRTRMYLVPGCEWRGAVDAHRELFAEVRPANATFYVAGFIPEGVLVEVELDAVVSA